MELSYSCIDDVSTLPQILNDSSDLTNCSLQIQDS